MAIAQALGDAAETPPGHRGGPRGAGLGSSRWLPYALLTPGLAWLALFFAIPLVILFLTSLQTPVPGGEIGAFEQTFSFSNYADVLTNSSYLIPLLRSFAFALIATVATLVIGYPLAYVIAFKAGAWKNFLLVLVVAPFFVSFLLRTIAWRQILGDEGPVMSLLRTVGLADPNSSIYPSSFAVVAGLTYNFLPFMVLPIYASLERIDTRLVEAAGDLYASGPVAFRRVTWPLSLPGVVAGTLLTFIPAAGDLVNAKLLGNRDSSMVGNRIEGLLLNANDYPTAAVLSFVLMIAILVLVGLYVRRSGTEDLV